MKKYSVLIVSSRPSLYEIFCFLDVLNDICDYVYKTDLPSARSELAVTDFDLIIIDCRINNGSEFGFASETASSTSASIIILTPDSQNHFLREKAEPYGIFTIGIPTNHNTLIQTVMLALNTAKQKKNKYSDLSVYSEELEELKLINRAKLILIDHFKMTENDAHRYILKRAMDMKEKKVTVAEKIIKTYGN